MAAPFGTTCIGRGPMTFSRVVFTPSTPSLSSFLSVYLTDTDLRKEIAGLTVVCKGDSLVVGIGETGKNGAKKQCRF